MKTGIIQVHTTLNSNSPQDKEAGCSARRLNQYYQTPDKNFRIILLYIFRATTSHIQYTTHTVQHNITLHLPYLLPTCQSILYIPATFRSIFGLFSRYLKICIHNTPRFIAETQTMLGKHRSSPMFTPYTITSCNVYTQSQFGTIRSFQPSQNKRNVPMYHFTVIPPPQTSQTRRYVTYEDRQR